MDGDQRMKQHERLMARSGNGTAGGRATDHFESAMHPRGDPTGMSQVPDRAQMPEDYGYTGSAFHGGALHPNDLPGYPDYARQRQAPAQGMPQQQHPHPAQVQAQTHSYAPHQQHLHQQQPIQQLSQARRRVAQDPPPQPFVGYEPAMLYGFGQQGPAQGSFDVVPQYSTRQSAAIEALSNPFAVQVPQYFPPEEQPTVTGVPAPTTYLNPQMPYNEPSPMARPNTTQPFPPTMAEFTGPSSSSRLDPQPTQHLSNPLRLPASDPSSLEEAYSYYQRALRNTFDHTRAGRLVEASRLLLEISEWLVTHARDLGRFALFCVFMIWCFGIFGDLSILFLLIFWDFDFSFHLFFPLFTLFFSRLMVFRVIFPASGRTESLVDQPYERCCMAGTKKEKKKKGPSYRIMLWTGPLFFFISLYSLSGIFSFLFDPFLYLFFPIWGVFFLAASLGISFCQWFFSLCLYYHSRFSLVLPAGTRHTSII